MIEFRSSGMSWWPWTDLPQDGLKKSFLLCRLSGCGQHSVCSWLGRLEAMSMPSGRRNGGSWIGGIVLCSGLLSHRRLGLKALFGVITKVLGLFFQWQQWLGRVVRRLLVFLYSRASYSFGRGPVGEALSNGGSLAQQFHQGVVSAVGGAISASSECVCTRQAILLLGLLPTFAWHVTMMFRAPTMCSLACGS